MEYDWYRIINRAEFLASGLVSKEVELNLIGKGLKTVLVTRGRLVSILVDGVFLPIGVTAANPFEFGGLAVGVDSATDDLYLGYPVDED